MHFLKFFLQFSFSSASVQVSFAFIYVEFRFIVVFFYKFTDYTLFLYLSRYGYLRTGHHFSPWEEGEGRGGGVG